jgi:hypothetical protein
MLIIPGFLIAIVTFPGVVVHEMGNRFFRIGSPAGYVVHAPAAGLSASFLTAIGPLIVNTVLCAVICFTPIIAFNLNLADLPGVSVLLLWLGISIGMHAFPSPQDAENLCAAVGASGRRELCYAVAKVFQFLVRIAQVLRFVWFDFVYAVVVASLIPVLIAHAAIY